MDNVQLDVANFNQRFSETYFAVLEVAPKRRSAKSGKKISTRKLRSKSVSDSTEQPAAP